MFIIERELIFLGYETKRSRISNREYTLVKYFNKGIVFATLLKCKKIELNELDRVRVKLEVIPGGRYVQLNTIEISKQ